MVKWAWTLMGKNGQNGQDKSWYITLWPNENRLFSKTCWLSLICHLMLNKSPSKFGKLWFLQKFANLMPNLGTKWIKLCIKTLDFSASLHPKSLRFWSEECSAVHSRVGFSYKLLVIIEKCQNDLGINICWTWFSAWSRDGSVSGPAAFNREMRQEEEGEERGSLR